MTIYNHYAILLKYKIKLLTVIYIKRGADPQTVGNIHFAIKASSTSMKES